MDRSEQRFQEMYQRHQRHVLAYFLRRTDATSARDGAAETFLVAWRRLDDVPPGDRELPWLYGVSRRVLANQRRSRDRYRALGRKLNHSALSEEQSPEVVVLRRAEDREMLDAVGRLRPEDQEVLRLTVWEELPHAEAAEVIGTSAHAVTQRLHRITKHLARDLQRPRHHRQPEEVIPDDITRRDTRTYGRGQPASGRRHDHRWAACRNDASGRTGETCG